MTSVTVVVPTFRRPGPLNRCIEGIRAMRRMPHEILIVVRPEDLEGREIATKWGARIADVVEQGHLPPLRTAILACRTDVMAVLDDDAVPRPDWLIRIERLFDRPDTVCVTGAVHEHSVDRATSVRGPWGPRAVELLRRRQGRTWYAGLAGLPSDSDCAAAGLVEPVDVSHLQGGNSAYLCSALKRIGIDMNLNRGAALGYEADLALGMGQYGRVLFDPLMVVDHFPATRHGAPGRRDELAYLEDYTQNLFYITAKHFGPMERIKFSAYMVAIGQRLSPGLLRAGEVARSEGVSARYVLGLTRAARRSGSRLGRERRLGRTAQDVRG